MRDYSTSRAFRNDNKISSTYIENFQTLLNQNRAGVRTLEFTSFYTELKRTSGSLSTVLTSSASKSTYANFAHLGWGLGTDGYYYNDVGFFRFDTSTLSSVYGLTNNRILDATLAVWTNGVLFYWGVNDIPLRACTVTLVDYMELSTLSSGNYAIPNNQASATLFKPPTGAYTHPCYSYNENVRMDFVSAPGFCQTLNLTGTTIVAVWSARVNQAGPLSIVYNATCATLSVSYIEA
jgi:hypothetical protein